jgi:energy-converting hydrogenase Eha subunit H
MSHHDGRHMPNSNPNLRPARHKITLAKVIGGNGGSVPFYWTRQNMWRQPICRTISKHFKSFQKLWN